MRIQNRGPEAIAALAVLAAAVRCGNESTNPPPVPSAIGLSSVAPDTLVEGQSATLTGLGFDPTPANNTVTIGGLSATVTTASSTTLSITVPPSNCQPARDAGVSVAVSRVTSNTITKRVHPASFLSLAVGQQVILEDPGQFCLEFRPAAAGGDAYLLGVGAAAEIPTGVLPFTTRSVAGVSATVPALTAKPLPFPTTTRRLSAPALNPQPIEAWLARGRAEMKIRDWERRHLDPAAFARARPSAPSGAPGRATAIPAVGDTIRLKVPDPTAPDECNTFTPIVTTVRAVGSAGIWVTDTANPTSDSLTQAEIQAYSDTFDTKVYAVDTLYFGTPSDIDGNQRIYIVLTIQVNKHRNVGGFAFQGDLAPVSACAESNQGELFYSIVPDPNNTAGTTAQPKASVLDFLPSLIAHEVTHIIQNSRRLVLSSGALLSSWEAEGQATLAEEVVGHSVLGNTTGQNYPASVIFSPGAGDRWYLDEFGKLVAYWGFLSANPPSRAANAPELCTLFGSGSTGLAIACRPASLYGASWLFQRYIADRFGPTYQGGLGGEVQLNRDWIGKNVGLTGVENVAALLSVNFDSLFAQWAAMQYVDDRVLGADSRLTLSSWNLFDFTNHIISVAQLLPADRTFTSFADSRSVRGGSNAYTRISAAGARPALAVRVRDPSDATLGTALRPLLWIVRLQ